MKKIPISLMGLIFLLHPNLNTCYGWVETFDSGTGRFNMTTGLGNTSFVYNPSAQNINATFVRRNSSIYSTPDRLLAPLDKTYNQDDVVGFSVEWSPQSYTDDYAWPLLGFFDSNTNQFIAGMKPRNSVSHGNSYEIPAGGFEVGKFGSWQNGETYLLDYQLDGISKTLTVSSSIWQSNQFVIMNTGIWSLPGGSEYSFDSLGMGNILNNGYINSTLIADIDNFTFIPEPLCCSLLTLGSSLFLLRRKKV